MNPSTLHRPMYRLRDFVGHFTGSTKGTASVELVLILPLLIWAIAASAMFFDGYRSRYHTTMAAQTIADIMSRQTDAFTEDYVEGLNDVYDFLVDSEFPTRIRVSSVSWDALGENLNLHWSYGSRGIGPLPDNAFALMQAGDTETLQAAFGDDTSATFAGASAQMPVSDLASRIPSILPDETLLVIETFAHWTPSIDIGMGQLRFDPVVAVRPRLAPFVSFEGIDSGFAGGGFEFDAPSNGPVAFPDPNILPDPIPDPIPDPVGSVFAFGFESGVTTGWSSSAIDTDYESNSFLGPFGTETWDTPVTLDVDFGGPIDTALIEFDLLIFDRWNGFQTSSDILPRGDAITLLIDGLPISVEPFEEDRKENYALPRSSVVHHDGVSYQVNMTPFDSNPYNFYGRSGLLRGEKDQLWHVSIAITNAMESFSLGFSAGINEPIDDESFGIDNLTLVSQGDGSGSVPIFTPDPTTLVGTDPYTRFPMFSGCPDVRLPAPWLTMDTKIVDKRYTVSRLAGGPTNLAVCNPDIPGIGFISAQPALYLNYRHDIDPSREVEKLRIKTDDGDNGRTCDSTLLLLDTHGQWWFNDDKDSLLSKLFKNQNSQLSLDRVPAGIYAVFIGTYGPTPCTTELTIERG